MLPNNKSTLQFFSVNKLTNQQQQMHHSNQQLIQRFYNAFQAGNATEMIACYHPEITFEDPAFGQLKGKEVGSMWAMLIERGKGDIDIQAFDIEADDETGSARWEARYTFGKTGRKVNNKIKARFKFKEGKIIDHQDDFNLWRWSSMALGLPGTLLGFTSFMQNKIRSQSRGFLKKYMDGK